jgi:uncharacterized membrane-anchored protein
MSGTPGPSPGVGGPLIRVPGPTAPFWAVAALAGTVGETLADLPATPLFAAPGATTAVVALPAAAVVALRCTRPRPTPVCWPAVVLVGVLAAWVPDDLTGGLGLLPELGAAVLAGALAATLGARWRLDRTARGSGAASAGREGLYWLAVLVTAALGTAVADLAAVRLGLGPWPTALLAGLVLAAVAVSCRVFGAGAVLAGWTAGVLTRSLGAALGDGLAQPAGQGGLGPGAPAVGLLLLAAALVLVVALSRAGSGRARIADPGGAHR